MEYGSPVIKCVHFIKNYWMKKHWTMSGKKKNLHLRCIVSFQIIITVRFNNDDDDDDGVNSDYENNNNNINHDKLY